MSTIPRAWVEHREVAELIAASRADEAADAMHEHVVMSRDAYAAIQNAGSVDLVIPADRHSRRPAAAPSPRPS